MHLISIITVSTIGLTSLIGATPLPSRQMHEFCIMVADKDGNLSPQSCIPIPELQMLGQGLNWKINSRGEEKPKKKVIVGINEFDMRGLETRNGNRKITPVKPSQFGIYVQEDGGDWKAVPNPGARDPNQKRGDEKADASEISKQKENQAKEFVKSLVGFVIADPIWLREEENSNIAMPDLEEYEMILVRKEDEEDHLASITLDSRSEMEKRIVVSAQGVDQWCIRKYDWSTRRCAKISGDRPTWEIMDVKCPENGLFGC